MDRSSEGQPVPGPAIFTALNERAKCDRTIRSNFLRHSRASWREGSKWSSRTSASRAVPPQGLEPVFGPFISGLISQKARNISDLSQ